ncbi:MAG: sugar-binding protein [Candidatus Kapabacteria bacterium]|nr:sugar-binding protein [Candidatus Kapabacteria bacterium]
MKKNILNLLFIILFSNLAFSQSGIKYPELVKRLDPYFDVSLLEDIRKQLPQGSDFNIWGYDVGDFSGDGYNDVAMSLRLSGDRSRKMHVYLFADIDGFLQNVGKFNYDFVDLPLEIGVVIRDNKCFVTKKNKQYDWIMDAYSFDNGALIKSEEFSTKRIGDLTYEKVRNYVDLKSSDKYIQTKNGQEVFFRKYLNLPSYWRGRMIYKGYEAELYSDYIDYVHEGAYWWKGEKDCSFRVSSSYDENFLYFTIDVNDESVVPQYCDTCITDMVDLWLDVNIAGEDNRFAYLTKDGKVNFKTKTETGVFRISVNPGNFLEREAWVKIATSDDLAPEQRAESKNIKAVSNLTDTGYIIKFKVPFTFLGFAVNPIGLDKSIEMGCTFIVQDYDNEFRPEEKTEIASSVFSPFDPTSYGSIILIPNKQWYGESVNIYTEDIIKALMEYGF